MLEGKPGADFANEGACCDNREADPETVDDSAEERDDLVAEEGREGYYD